VFLMLCLASFTSCLGFFAPFTHAAAFAEEIGCTEETGTQAFMMFGALSIVGRLVAGPLGDRFGALVVWPSGILACAGTILWLGNAPSCDHIIFSMGALGLASGPVIALLGPLLVELFGMERLPLALGPMFFMNGIGGMLSPAIAGFIMDVAGNYRASFVVASIFLLLASFGMLIVRCLHSRQRASSASLANKTETPQCISADHPQEKTCSQLEGSEINHVRAMCRITPITPQRPKRAEEPSTAKGSQGIVASI